MKNLSLTLLLALFTTTAQAAFFVDPAALREMLTEFEAYQERREIRYMAKASQYVGYVTGVVDALDGTQFCLIGGVGAEQAARMVAQYLQQHPERFTRRASEAVVSALAAHFPCAKPAGPSADRSP